MSDQKHVDEFSGVETTGHEWDGIRELNNPMPRWWLWTFYATIVWAIGYCIAYPSFPLINTHLKGVLGYSSRAEVVKQIDAAKAAQAGMFEKINAASLEEIRTTPELLEFARAGGESAFAVNCSQCHGSGAQGNVGYPNLNDDDWLWGGSLETIHHSITHGIRNEQSDDAYFSEMPRFGADEILEKDQINAVAEYVLSLSGASTDVAAATAGEEVYVEQCAACHGDAGEGLAELGAPNLSDPVWLYGGDKAAVVQSITYSRAGVMPAWGLLLPEETVKQLAVYVHSLGGGE